MAANDAKNWMSQIPGYIGTVISIGSLIFSVGVLYSDVNKLKVDMIDLQESSYKQESIITRVNVLQMQVERTEQIQDKFVDRLDNIDKNLSAIQVGLARLDERIPYERSNKEKVK